MTDKCPVPPPALFVLFTSRRLLVFLSQPGLPKLVLQAQQKCHFLWEAFPMSCHLPERNEELMLPRFFLPFAHNVSAGEHSCVGFLLLSLVQRLTRELLSVG